MVTRMEHLRDVAKSAVGPSARVQPRITHQGPVVHPIDAGHRRGGRGLRPSLAGRKPDELLRGRTARPGRLDLGTAGPALAALHLARPLGFLLGLALVFLAAAIAAVHPRSFLSHSAPFSLSPLYMTGRTTSPETRRAGARRPRALHRRQALRVSALRTPPPRLVDIGPQGPRHPRG